jgi:hypothetical protein
MGLSRISWVESKTKSGHWFVVVLPTVGFCCIDWKVGAVCTYSLGSAIVVVVVMCLVDAHLLVDCWVGSPCSIFLESFCHVVAFLGFFDHVIVPVVLRVSLDLEAFIH